MSTNEDQIFQSEADFWKEQTSMKAYRDIKNSLDTKWEEGHKAEKIEIAKRALAKWLQIEDVMDITGLTREEIEKLKDK